MKNRPVNVNAPGLPQADRAATFEPTIDSSTKLADIFVMTLQTFDLWASLSGVDNHKIHIPLEACRASPQFWGWPEKFSSVQNTRQTNLRVRPITIELPDGKKYDSRLVSHPATGRFGLCLETFGKPFGLREAGELLIFVRYPDSGADFLVQVVHKHEPFHRQLLRRCQRRAKVSDGHRHFGYMDMHFDSCLPRRKVWVVIDYRQKKTVYRVFDQKSQAIDDCKAVERCNGLAKIVPFAEEFET